MTPGNVFLKMGDKETVVPLKLTNWGGYRGDQHQLYLLLYR